MTANRTLSAEELAIDRELAAIAAGLRFLLDLTPVDLVAAREHFRETRQAPKFEYRPLADDPDVELRRLDDVRVEAVRDATLESVLLAKQRELRLQLEMLSCRGSEEFLALSIELYGSVSPRLLAQAEGIPAAGPVPAPDPGPRLDAGRFGQ